MKSGGAIVLVGLLFVLLVVGLMFVALRQRRVRPVAQAKPGVYGLVGQGIGAIIGNWGSWSTGGSMTRSGNDSIGSGSWNWYDNIGKPDTGANLGNWSDKLSLDPEFGSSWGGAGKADQFGWTGPAAGAPMPLDAVVQSSIPALDLKLESGTTPGGAQMFDFGTP